MIYTNKNGLKISKMTLGTVQLGMNYGINNISGTPNKESSFAILNKAYDCGVTMLDTSDDYGNSEEIIGDFLKEYKTKNFSICTKFKLTNNVQGDVYTTIKDSALRSISKLNIDHIDIFMSHTEQDYINYSSEMIDALSRLKKEGIILNSGLSLSRKNLLTEIVKYGGFDAIQIPLNIFDNKELLNGDIRETADAGVMVFVRSIYLQGLFFKNPQQLSETKLSCAIPYLEILNRIAKKYNMTVQQLAFLFMRDHYGVDSLVIGSETADQVDKNAELFDLEKLTDDVFDDIKNHFYNVDEFVISPWKWSK